MPSGLEDFTAALFGMGDNSLPKDKGLVSLVWTEQWKGIRAVDQMVVQSNWAQHSSAMACAFRGVPPPPPAAATEADEVFVAGVWAGGLPAGLQGPWQPQPFRCMTPGWALWICVHQKGICQSLLAHV